MKPIFNKVKRTKSAVDKIHFIPLKRVSEEDVLPEELLLDDVTLSAGPEPMRKTRKRDKDKNRFLLKQRAVAEDLAYWEDVLKTRPNDKKAEAAVAELKARIKTRVRVAKSDIVVEPSTQRAKPKKSKRDTAVHVV